MSTLAAAELARNVSMALEMLRRPEHAFARDFLLATGEDAQGDMVMLSNPVALDNAVAAHIEGEELPQTVVAASTGAGVGVVSDAAANPSVPVRVLYTMIPSFSVGNCTVGISVHRVGCPIATNGKCMYMMGRFMRDEETSETLLASTALLSSTASEKQQSGSMVYFRHDTTTRQFHLFASTVPGVSFRRIYNDYQKGDLRALARNFQFGEVIHQVRVAGCPVCGLAASNDCQCVLDVSLPKSALDFSVFKKNHRTHLGVFSGPSVLSILEPPSTGVDGNPVVSSDNGYPRFLRVTTGSQDADTTEADSSLARLLHQMAIQDRCQRASPCRAIMPTPMDHNGGNARAKLDAMYSVETCVSHTEAFFRAKGIERANRIMHLFGAGKREEPVGDAAMTVQHKSSLILSVGSSASVGSRSQPASGSSAELAPAPLSAPVPIPIDCSGLEPMDSTVPSAEVDGQTAGGDVLSYWNANETGGNIDGSPPFPFLTGNGASGVSEIDVDSFMDAPPPITASFATSLDQDLNVSVVRHPGLPSSASPENPSAVVDVPQKSTCGVKQAPGSATVAADAADMESSLAKAIAEATADPVLVEEDRKLTRKEKNRLAAARSNQRRKQEMDSLKRAVADSRERVRRLQEKEALLRNKNLELKSSAAALWMKDRTGTSA